MLVDTDVPAGADGRFGTEDDGLRLQEGSPAIDAGNGAALPTDVADIDGDSDTGELLPLDLTGRMRVAGDRVDLGAYEFGAGFGVVPSILAADGCGCNGSGSGTLNSNPGSTI